MATPPVIVSNADLAAAPSAKGKERATDDAAAAAAAPSSGPEAPRLATSIIVLGLAGSGKTTLVQRLNAHLHSRKRPPYLVQLDPAVAKVPYQANIDIRDSVDYKEVMKQYNLGPNGGILTALNLFVTKFDQAMALIEKRAPTVDHVIIDTPGQIEIFTWSASGAIITDAMASAMPCCVAYVIDTARTASPTTFMSNMLYACSILYKTRLPFVLVFNKTDVRDHAFALEWMHDFEAYQAALAQAREAGGSDDGPGYMSSLMNSMSLVLDTFYQNLRTVGVSAMTGAGMDDFFAAIDDARKEYDAEYKPELERLKAERAKQREAGQQEQLSRLVNDMNVSGRTTSTRARPSTATAAAADDDRIESDEDWDEGPDAPRAETGPQSGLGQRRRFGGIEEDGLGGRWPAPRG